MFKCEQGPRHYMYLELSFSEDTTEFLCWFEMHIPQQIPSASARSIITTSKQFLLDHLPI